MRVKSPYKIGDPVSHVEDPAAAGVIIFDNAATVGKTISVHWDIVPNRKNLHRDGRGEYKLEELIIKRIKRVLPSSLIKEEITPQE